MAKNIFIAATDKDVGKSTISFALINYLQSKNKKVGFMKPVGQRWLPSQWGDVEEDVILMKEVFKFEEEPSWMNPVVVRKGFTEEYLTKMIKPDLESKIKESYSKVSKDKDYVVIEGTGHGGVGAVLEKSNADVASILDADVVLLVKGGIGSAIDKLDLNLVYFRSKGVKVKGVIVNKVIMSKYDKVKKMLSKYCKSKNLILYGVIPYSPILSNPTLGQIIDELRPQIINDNNERKFVIDDFLVGASKLEEFVSYFNKKVGNILVVLPSSRLDISFAITNLKKILDMNNKRIFTLLFSGITPPSDMISKTLENENINMLWKKGDTYSVVSKLSRISIKTRAEDSYKIDEIKKIVISNINIRKMLSSIKSSSIKHSGNNKALYLIKSIWKKIKSLFGYNR